MEEKTKYYLLKQKAVPEVLLKVAEAKKLIASEKAMTIQEATDQLGISRRYFSILRQRQGQNDYHGAADG